MQLIVLIVAVPVVVTDESASLLAFAHTANVTSGSGVS